MGWVLCLSCASITQGTTGIFRYCPGSESAEFPIIGMLRANADVANDGRYPRTIALCILYLHYWTAAALKFHKRGDRPQAWSGNKERCMYQGKHMFLA